MGYSYGRNSRGNMALSCDGCGTCEGVRKRTCPHKVTGYTLTGPRVALNYCPPPAYCGACLAARGGNAKVHAGCTDGAARMQADADAKQATLDAGGLLVMAAFGSWQDTVPAGMVGVKFTGRAGDSWGLVAEGDYDPGKRPALSDYPGAADWTDHP